MTSCIIFTSFWPLTVLIRNRRYSEYLGWPSIATTIEATGNWSPKLEISNPSIRLGVFGKFSNSWRSPNRSILSDNLDCSSTTVTSFFSKISWAFFWARFMSCRFRPRFGTCNFTWLVNLPLVNWLRLTVNQSWIVSSESISVGKIMNLGINAASE